jgi:hypothetical protein
MLLELLGLTPEQIAKGETWSATDGERTRDTGDKVGDKVLSILTGTDYAAEVEKHARKNYGTKMTRKFGGDIEDVKGVAGYEEIGDLTKLEPEQIQREIDRRNKTRNARSSYKALTGEDFDDTTITDPGTIKASATRTLKDEVETKEEKTRDRQTAETRRQEGREDDRLAMTMELSRLDRKDEREARRDERAYQNRKLDMQEARLDRKDRQAAIQSMMAGLAQLGASIAI